MLSSFGKPGHTFTVALPQEAGKEIGRVQSPGSAQPPRAGWRSQSAPDLVLRTVVAVITVCVSDSKTDVYVLHL